MKSTEVVIPPPRDSKTNKAISMIYITSIYQYQQTICYKMLIISLFNWMF